MDEQLNLETPIWNFLFFPTNYLNWDNLKTVTFHGIRLDLNAFSDKALLNSQGCVFGQPEMWEIWIINENISPYGSENLP